MAMTLIPLHANRTWRRSSKKPILCNSNSNFQTVSEDAFPEVPKHRVLGSSFRAFFSEDPGCNLLRLLAYLILREPARKGGSVWACWAVGAAGKTRTRGQRTGPRAKSRRRAARLRATRS